MAILGISSATKTISVGLCDEGQILAELNISGKQAFTEDLIVYIDEVVRQAGKKLSAVSVASGPGSYNGLRGGLSTAKTIAQSLSIPLVEVSTLESIAYNLIDLEATICAITDAKREEFNAAFFTVSKKTLRRITKDSVMHSDKIVNLLSKVEGSLFLCGTTDAILAAIKAINPDTKIVEASNALSISKGSNVALIGEKLLNEGKTIDVMKAAPKYSVQPNIREFKKQSL